jgi:two-component system cell cycle sensor histidine kinase/response regulator CckA
MISRADLSRPINQAVSTPRGTRPLRARARERLPWAYLAAFFLGTALVSTFIWYQIESERQVVLANWQARVTAIAEGRARLVSDWFNARRADADVLAASPSVRAFVLEGGGKGGDVRGALVPQLDRVATAYGYSGISLMDTQGRTLARSTGAADPGRESAEAVLLAVRNRAMRADLVEEARRKLLVISVPIFGDGTGPNRPVVGVVALMMDPATRLFPLLSDETVPTRTGETLLFRIDGPKPSYISTLKGQSAGWSAVDRSLEDLVPLAKRAADGRETFGEMFDYRATPVFAATRWIAPAGWGLVLKVDREEALADFYQAGKLAGLAGAFLTLALAGVLISLWRQSQRAALLREQMKQERAIFNLKGYAEKIVASVPSGLLLLSADLRVLSANRSFLESFFLRRDEVVGRGLEEVVRAEGLVRRAREVMQSGVAQPDMLFELHLLHRQETRPVRVTMTGIRIEEQEEARLLLIIEDLTEEERLQSARLASEQRFQDLVQGLDAIVWEADAATLRFSFVSQRAQTIFGFPTERWLEQPSWFSERIHPEDRAKVMALCRAALTRGEDHELEYRALTAAGEIVWLRDIVHVVPDGPGNAGQLRGLTVDLTELKHADEALRTSEDHLRQAQKMDAVGKLAGGIAHDFNNLLMVIRGDSDLMLRRLPPIHPLRKNAEGIREAADQAATLTRQLLAFSRKQVLAPKVLELNSIVAGMQTMLQRLIGETINLVVVPEPTLNRVKADPGQIEQVMMNLAVNARDAMPDGGRLMIRTANVQAGEVPPPPGGAAAAPGPHVMLEVSDTGTGMDADTQVHLFEPFFTTKEQGKGTGLGLSTVYGIVEQSGGSIAVDTELGRGTTFRIYLPQVDAPAQPRESPVAPATRFPTARPATPAPGRPAPAVVAAVASTTAPPALPRVAQAPAAQVSSRVAATTPGSPTVAPRSTPSRAETILLVEDALRVRAVVREILEMNGYHVLEARHGAEALEISERHQGPIHIMVTDVVMPQMSGRELAQRLAPVRPDMKVLYMSGYTDDAIVRHGVLGAGMAFLSKPFTPDALAVKVREVLETQLAPSAQDAPPSANGGAPPNGNGAPPAPAEIPAKTTTATPTGTIIQRAEDIGQNRPTRV